METKSARKKRYLAVIASARWKRFRRQIIAQMDGRCEACKTQFEGKATSLLHLHHLSYARLGAEMREDVQLLCDVCHEIKHGRPLAAKRGWAEWNQKNHESLRSELIAAGIPLRDSDHWSPYDLDDETGLNALGEGEFDYA